MLVIIIVLVLCCGALIVAAVRRATRAPAFRLGINQFAEAAVIARHTRVWRAVGIAVGLAAAVGLTWLSSGGRDLGRLVALAPVALGGCILLGVVVGQLTVRPPRGVVRSATVQTRSMRDYVDRGHVGTLIGASTVVAGLLLLGTSWATPDDMGRPGRTLTRLCTTLAPDGTTVRVGGSSGPWPGEFYTVPILGGLLVVGLLGWLAAWAAVRRRRPGSESSELDDRLRRWSLADVIDACLVTLAATAAPLSLIMANALGSSQCSTTRDAIISWVLAGVGAVATVVTVVVLARLLSPPRVAVDDLPPPPQPADPTPVGAPVR